MSNVESQANQLQGKSPPKYKVLAYEKNDARDLSLDWLRQQGMEVEYGWADSRSGFTHYSEEDIIEAATGYDAVIGSSGAQFTRRVLEALPELKIISKLGIGVDSIDIETATKLGILVSNTPETAGVTAVAEHAIALMLAVCKRLNYWTPQHLQRGGWRNEAEFAFMLDGSTVGIVGFGRIGQAVAARLAPWNVRILAYDPLPKEVDGVEMVTLERLLAECDLVTLHCGASPENFHLLNEQSFARMKQGAILVNSGRGMLVDEKALLEQLRSGHLAGAALDVFEHEPPDPDDPLLKEPNVILTPHAATRTLKVFLDRRWLAARNLYAISVGDDCPNLVNPQAVGKRRAAE